MSSPHVENLLGSILQELREIRELMGEMKEVIRSREAPATPNPIPDITPYYPGVPNAQPPSITRSVCSRCGMSLAGAVSYHCPDPTCPTGLGSTSC